MKGNGAAVEQELAQAAGANGLRYVSDEMPGLRRERSGAGFRCRYPTGDIFADPPVLQRIKSGDTAGLARRLRPEEAAVLALLQQRLAGEEKRLAHQLKASLKNPRGKSEKIIAK